MKLPRVLPESMLRLMSAGDRRKLGKAGITKAEAGASADIKNERDLQCLIVNYLRLRGIEPLWFRTDKRTTANIGWPDITFSILCPDKEMGYIARPCVWEVKFGNGKLSKEQADLAYKLKFNGWRHRVITSLEQARQELEALGCDGPS